MEELVVNFDGAYHPQMILSNCRQNANDFLVLKESLNSLQFRLTDISLLKVKQSHSSYFYKKNY